MSDLLRYDLVAARKKPARRTCIILHGLGDSKDGWKPVAQAIDLPDWQFIFVQAPDAYGPGFSWFDTFDPYTGAFVPPEQRQIGITRSHAALRALWTHLKEKHGLSADQTAIMGFSQGCLMTLTFALASDEIFAAIIGISGWLPTESYPAALGSAAKQQHIFWSHGTEDTLLELENTERSMRYLKELGLRITWRTYDKAHSLDPEEIDDIRQFMEKC